MDPVDKEIKQPHKDDVPPRDLREDWEWEDAELTDRKPTLGEIEGDTSNL